MSVREFKWVDGVTLYWHQSDRDRFLHIYATAKGSEELAKLAEKSDKSVHKLISELLSHTMRRVGIQAPLTDFSGVCITRRSVNGSSILAVRLRSPDGILLDIDTYTYVYQKILPPLKSLPVCDCP